MYLQIIVTLVAEVDKQNDPHATYLTNAARNFIEYVANCTVLFATFSAHAGQGGARWLNRAQSQTQACAAVLQLAGPLHNNLHGYSTTISRATAP
jgi:hypothetical protein